MALFGVEEVLEGNALVIRTRGYLDDKGGVLLKQAVERGFGKGHRRFVFNLAGSPVINSQGIAMVFEMAEEITEVNKGTLAFVGLSPNNTEVFRTVGLFMLGRSYPTEAEATADL